MDTFPSRESIRVTTRDECELELQRYGDGEEAVLLVHGASAASDTFRTAETKSLARDLVGEHFDVWTLDWRASWRCVADIYRNAAKDDPTSAILTVDAAAEHDVPAAIDVMRKHGVTGKIGLVGHCLGGGLVAQGIACGHIQPTDVTNVVLVALGLFYRPALDTLIKAEDRPLEELLATGEGLLHPVKKARAAKGDGIWDPLLEEPYRVWSKTPIPHDCQSEFCHRLSYLFGMPYDPARIPQVHEHLDSQFGWIATQFLLHCAQNLRRGHAAPFNAPMDDRQYLQPQRFRDFNLTLITGDLNCLWHRDSIDTMYEWLRRGPKQGQPRGLRKHVLPHYAHQDLLWGVDAPKEVFWRVREGLRVPASIAAAGSFADTAEEAHMP